MHVIPQKQVSVYSDTTQKFISLCGERGCGNHVIWKIWAQVTQCCLSANTCWGVVFGGGIQKVWAWGSQTHLAANTNSQEAGLRGIVLHQPEARCSISAVTLRQWNSLLAREDRATNHHSLLSWKRRGSLWVHVRPFPSLQLLSLFSSVTSGLCCSDLLPCLLSHMFSPYCCCDFPK
jgi:hypothetical protein